MNPENRPANSIEGRRFSLQNYFDSLYKKYKEESLTTLRSENQEVVSDAEKLITTLEGEGLLNEDDYVSGRAYLSAEAILASISDNMAAYDEGDRADLAVKFGRSQNGRVYRDLRNKYGDLDESAEESEKHKDEIYIFDKSYEALIELQGMAKLHRPST